VSWLGQLFVRARMRRDLEEELRAHLDEKVDELMAAGVPRDEATAQARRELGNVSDIEERAGDVWRWPMVDDFLLDLRHAARMLRKSPLFTVVAVVTLALGIGANTAIFSVVNDVLLAPLPFAHPEQLVTVHSMQAGRRFGPSLPDVRDLARESRTLAQLVGCDTWNKNVSATPASEPEPMRVGLVPPSYFTTLEIAPIRGRLFTADENRWGSHHVALITAGFWRTHYGEDSRILERSLLINDEPYRIIGVVPDVIPTWMDAQHADVRVFTPFGAFGPEDPFAESSRDGRGFFTVGRLRPGATIEQARAELRLIAAGLAARYPVDRGISATVEPLVETRAGTMRPILLVLMGAVGLILLIACFNVANLMVARNSTRRHELAIRSSLGASRARLLRQLLTESLLLGLLGGALGLALAEMSGQLIGSLHVAAASQLATARLDGRVLAFTFAVVVGTSIVFGIAPAWSAARANPQAALRDGGRADTGGRHRRSLRRMLVAAEVALSLMLSIGAGLLVRTVVRLQSQDLGFRSDHLLTARLYLPNARYGDSDSITRVSDRLAERARDLPGVVDASAGDLVPPAYQWAFAFAVVGRPLPATTAVPTANFGTVDTRYVKTLGIPLLRGRDFDASDTATSPRVVLINETFARRYFPGEDPIGKQIDVGTPGRLEPPVQGKPMPRLTIVGVIGDTRNRGLSLPPDPDMIGLYRQNPEQNSAFKRLILRTSVAPSSLVPSLRAAVRAIDRDLPLFEVRTIEQLVAQQNADSLFGTTLLSLFALLGLSLAVVGVYGVASYTVAQRRREIAIRMALGARADQVLRLVLREGLVVGGWGIVVGIAGALAITRVAASVLHGVSPRDPITFVVGVIAVAAAVLVATLLPCWRATRVEAAEALQAE